MSSSNLTAVQKVQAVLDRIKEKDGRVNSIIAINPNAIRDAEILDNEVENRGALHGEPVLVKDNIAVSGMPTTAGSLALKDNLALEDAPVVASLKKAGCVIVAKTNLSEWANFRDEKSSSGWSALGGLTQNPVRTPEGEPLTALGSSSGSGAAVALGLASAALGSETDGSITGPASMCGIVGLKPTVGNLSGKGIVPIALSQDTAGPMTKDIKMAALMMAALAPDLKIDLDKVLDKNALKGKKLGVMKHSCPSANEEVMDLFKKALDKMRSLGAEIVEIPEEAAPDLETVHSDEFEKVLIREFKDDINEYLASTDPDKVKTRTLEELIKFNLDNEDKEMPHFKQSHFDMAQATKGRQEENYAEAAANIKRIAGKDGIDRLLSSFNCDVLICPTSCPAFKICLDGGDEVHGEGWDHNRSTMMPAVSGYPHLTVPMGKVSDGRPVGISFIGTANDEPLLLSVGYAFEQGSAQP